jgi:16S rRNA (guanine966-N2)-methyltransferase
MSRIIGGDAKSLTLAGAPKGTRPTSDRVRESLFGVLQSKDWLAEGDRVLDLYCGTGALALEAVSRGAAKAILVDAAAAATAVARKNCEKLQATLAKNSVNPRKVSLTVTQTKVAPWLRRADVGNFDLIFVDPPYELADFELWQQLAPIERMLANDGLLVIERPRRRQILAAPDWLEPAFERTWGDTQMAGYRLRSGGPT